MCFSANLSRAHVPTPGEVDRGPGAPGLGGVVDTQSALKTRVAAGQDLAPEISPQRGIVADPRAATAVVVSENRTARRGVLGPDGIVGGIEP